MIVNEKVGIKLSNNYVKNGVITMFLSLFLLILGVRYVLGQELELMNLLAFLAFSLAVGSISGAMLFYKLKIAFYLFSVGLAIGFFDLFRSFIVNTGGFGDLAGILSLFIFTSFGLVIGVIVEAIIYLVKKKK